MEPERVRDPAAVLRRIAFLLERAQEPTFRVLAFRRAAATVEALEAGELTELAANGSLRSLPGIGEVTARVITEVLSGDVPAYLRRLEAASESSVGAGLRAALRGDLHVHSDWSDGGSPIAEMARTARDLGHAYIALTDHSPRLTVANGLSAERLRAQLDEVARLNEGFAEQAQAGAPPFRILTGIEVDLLPDGSLDQEEQLLARLDVVVASVHSELRMPAEPMTQRLVTAIANPHMDILGHCTGRIVVGRRGRPESQFDAARVFATCARYDVAVEVNSRPERKDPPKRLLRVAIEAGCQLAINTDAHAPGQLDWLLTGCDRAALSGAEPGIVVNARPLDDLLAWTARGASR